MLKLQFDLNKFSKTSLFKHPVLIKQGFKVGDCSSYLREFYELLLNPLHGAHAAFSEHKSLVKIYHDSEKLNPSVWSHQFEGDEGLYRDASAILKAIDLKASVVFDEYYRYSQCAKELACFFQEQFKCSAGCNAYLSQKGGKAFKRHRDCHHVFIFAVSGKKRWKVYNARQEPYQAYAWLPSDQTDEAIEAQGLAYDEVMLPGDILYIPMGHFHQVTNLSDNALHYTISCNFRPTYTMLDDILNLINEADFQSEIPREVREILNQVHPMHLKNEVDTTDVSDALKKLSKLIDILSTSTKFLELQNKPKQNKRLKVFTSPNKKLIEDIVSCTE